MCIFFFFFFYGYMGGNLIIKELTGVADIDYVTKAPDGKEVEEITKKEIHKALRGRISAEQAKLEIGKETEKSESDAIRRPSFNRPVPVRQVIDNRFVKKTTSLSEEEKKTFKSMLENLIGTRGAHVLDEKLNILGKVPISELQATIKSLGSGVYAVVFDGIIDRDFVKVAEKTNIQYLVAMDSRVKAGETNIGLLTVNDF